MNSLSRILLVLLCAVAVTATARAADWYVDAANCPGGSGTAGDPFCQITDAVNAAADGDRILIAAGTYGEQIILDKDLALEGAGAATTILDGQNQRCVDVLAGATVTMVDLSITGGASTLGAGIHNSGNLFLGMCTVEANGYSNPFNPFIGASGAGIANSGNLTMNGCTVRNNNIRTDANGDGAGIYNLGTLSMKSCVVHNNSLSFSDPIDPGGGFDGAGISNFGTATLENCTVSDNSAVGCCVRGGGISNQGTMSLANTTVANNEAGGTALTFPPFASGGGIFGTVTATHTIVGDNIAWVGLTGTLCGEDWCGTLVSGGYNLIELLDGSIQGDPTGNIFGDPLLGPLGDHGGPTHTLPLLAGSPAIDAGNPDATQCPPVDGRNLGRAASNPLVNSCDIGAFELGATAVFSLAATPSTAPIGTDVQITSTGGPPLAPLSLFVVDVSGVPTFLLMTRGTIGYNSAWAPTFAIPADPGLQGITILLRGYSFDPAGTLLQSNDALLAFQ